MKGTHFAPQENDGFFQADLWCHLGLVMVTFFANMLSLKVRNKGRTDGFLSAAGCQQKIPLTLKEIILSSVSWRDRGRESLLQKLREGG